MKTQNEEQNIEFSPRARGCSLIGASSQFTEAVFPACAGMFLIAECDLTLAERFPRVRGDVPSNTSI